MPALDLETLVSKPAREKTVPILSDYSSVENYEKIAFELQGLPAAHPKYKTLQKQLRRIEEEIDEATFEINFKAISRKDFRYLLDYHQPTEDQKKKEPNLQFNPETFPAALIAACCEEPKLSFEDAKRIFDEWSESEAWALFEAAWEVCVKRTTPDYVELIWNDSQLRTELRICNQFAIPHSIFCGRGMPGPGEPMWLEEDQDKAIAFSIVESEICQRCGTAEREWTDGPDTFIADAKRDFGCQAIETYYANVPSDQKGVRVFLRRPTPEDYSGVGLERRIAAETKQNQQVLELKGGLV